MRTVVCATNLDKEFANRMATVLEKNLSCTDFL